MTIENPFNSQEYARKFFSEFYQQKQEVVQLKKEKLAHAEANLARAQRVIREVHIPAAIKRAEEEEYWGNRADEFEQNQIQKKLVDDSNNLGKITKDPLAKIHHVMNKGKRTLDFSKEVGEDIRYQKNRRYPKRGGWGKYGNLTRKQAAQRMQNFIDQTSMVRLNPRAPLPDEVWRQILKEK